VAVPRCSQRRDQPDATGRELDAPAASPCRTPRNRAPESDFLRSERERELHTALAGLAPDARAALLLAAEGFNGQEVAASIGRSEGATRTLLCRSRVRLRLALEAQEGRP
jgi:DNA-directed RNA polymerase specialized sigma24 family protein